MKQSKRILNPFLYLFYRAAKLLARLVFKIFFSKTTILNKDTLRIDYPSIVVSNHPNTLLDPLNVACRIKGKEAHFLANASLFKSKFGNWFFNTFYCIPIERPKDVKGKRIQNAEAFAKCDDFLGKGGCLYIAPEGTSVIERKLRTVKTGTARIALSAENKNNFQLGLKIIPIGLTYTDPKNFRGEVLLNVGKPIIIADYKNLYQENTVKATKKLTADLQEKMESLLLNPEDSDMDLVVQKLEEIQQNDNPLPPDQHFLRTQKLVQHLRKWKNKQPKTYERWQKKVIHYFYQIIQNRTADYPIGLAEIMTIGQRWKYLLPAPFLLFAYLYGFINNFLANYIPALLTKTLNLDQGYDSNVKTLSGLLTYPIFYGLQIWFVHWLFRNWWVTVIYALSLYPMGMLTLWLEKKAKKIGQRFRYDFLVQTKGSKMEELEKLRAEVKGVMNYE